MDEPNSPKNILDEIFSRSQPPPFQERPQFDLPPEEEPPPPPPSGRAGAKGRSGTEKLLLCLCLTLGAALLALGICVFQLAGLNRRLDGLQDAVEAVQSVDSFTQLQADLEAQTERAIQAERVRDDFRETWEHTFQSLKVVTVQKWQRDYLFYIGQLMDNGDYPMAALAAVLSADRYFDAANLENIPGNPAQTEQYHTYLRELADKGYLELGLRRPVDSSFTLPSFPEQVDPEQNPDMAALGILWCALDAYYVGDDPDTAAQYLVRYQWYALTETGDDRYPQRILDTASDYTVRLYQQMIQDLTKAGWLTERDGALFYSEEAPSSSDVLYSLPFDPPGGWLYGEIPLS